jgi:hypothetical protein
MITKIINSIKKVLSIDNDKLHKAVSDFDLYNANTRRLHRHYDNMINTIEDDEIKKSFEDSHFEDLNELYKSNIDVVKTLSECIDKRIDDLQKRKSEYAYKDKMKKSLGMSRDKMPQVDSDNITDFILHFDQKVGVSKVKRKLSQLKPAQGEINEDKLNYFLANKKNEKVKKTKYIISNDNYLIDGHHRWAANLELKNENDTVSCYRINLPAQELIKRANKLNVTKNVDINDNTLTKSLVTIALAKTQGLIPDELVNIIKARVNTLVPVERIKIKDGKQFSSISYIDKDVFEKSHKYLRKEPDGKGGFNYIYEENEKKTDTSKIISSSSRFRPIETINFESPIIGPNGAKLLSYTWAYEWIEDWNEHKGETVEKRVSDWTRAEQSSDTGKGIVHQFVVKLPNGDTKVVSSESVLILLGITERNKIQGFSSLVSAVKTLSKQKLQLVVLNDKLATVKKIDDEINKMPKPEIERSEADHREDQIKWTMGDASVYDDKEIFDWQTKTKSPNLTISEERLGGLIDSWKKNRYKEKGLNPHSDSLSRIESNIRDLKNRIERQERKVNSITEESNNKLPDNINEKLEKAFELGLIDKETFEKAKTGIYIDSPENRRLKRVGQKYGSSGINEPEVDKNNKKTEDNTQDKPKKTIEEYAKETSDADLQNAAKGEDEKLRIAAKKELERRETEHNPEEEKTDNKDKETKDTSKKEDKKGTENKKAEVGLKEGDLSNVGIIQEVYKDQYRINNIWYHKRMITPVDDSDKEVKEQAEVNDIISKLEEENGKGFITLFHGTDSKSYENINKKGVFGQDSTISFLTSNKEEAKEYSNNKAKYRGVEKGNVLEVTIPKWSVKKNPATGEFETELTFENRNGKWYPTNKSILSVYGKKSNDITKSSEIDLANFESNDISKSIDIIIKALESGIIDYDNIEKAHKYIRKEPDGKGGFNYIYEETKDHQKKDVKFDIGTTISDNEKGLAIQRYSEKAIIIKGNTYANVDLLRKIKEEIGVGNWNKALKGWIFPLSYVDQVMGYIISNTEDEDKKEALINTKNASVEVGELVTIAGNLTGKVEANTSDETGIKYDVTLDNGTKLTGVDEKVMEVKPETDDAKISDLVNNSQPENRAKTEKKLFGIKPIENIYQYYLFDYLIMNGVDEYSYDGDFAEILKQKHKEAVKLAIEEGKEISDNNLDFYPDLKEVYGKKRQAMSEETKRKISEALKKHKVEPESLEIQKEEEEAKEQGFQIVEKENYVPKNGEDIIITSPSNTVQREPLVIKTKDYTDIPALDIIIPKEKNILTSPKPYFIPEINLDRFRRNGYTLSAVKLDEDKYLVALDGFEPARTSLISSIEAVNKYGNFAIMSLDCYTATQNYYQLKSKVEYKKEQLDEYEKKKQLTIKSIEEIGSIQDEEKRRNTLEYLTRNLKYYEEHKPSLKRLKILADNRMTYDQMHMIEMLKQKDGMKLGNREVWDIYNKMSKDRSQKSIDMQLHQEYLDSVYTKGAKTSYGDSGTKDDLYNEYGVKVKRQNGDEIKESEIKTIKNALDSISKVFGKNVEMNKEFGLKISHSGEKLMHASKYFGLFHPFYNAIGVTNVGGNKQFGFVLGHEYGHFMDYWIGKNTGNHYASDKQGSIANEIANTFKKGMNKKSSSDYWNRTCECFARAMEQYHAVEVNNDTEYFDNDNYVSKEKYEKVKPLIEQFFKENKEFLKAFGNDDIFPSQLKLQLD